MLQRVRRPRPTQRCRRRPPPRFLLLQWRRRPRPTQLRRPRPWLTCRRTVSSVAERVQFQGGNLATKTALRVAAPCGPAAAGGGMQRHGFPLSGCWSTPAAPAVLVLAHEFSCGRGKPSRPERWKVCQRCHWYP